MNAVITEELLATVFSQHSAQLKHTEIAHAPFCITFSGTPGMGKSFVAKQLEQKYQAVRICTDELRLLATNTGSIERKEYEEFIQQYFAYFFKHYTGVNKRFIIDASIDRRYTVLFPFFEKLHIPFAVIRLEVPRDIVVMRIKEREKDNAENYLKFLDKWFTDYQEFEKHYTQYIRFNNQDREAVERLVIPGI